MCVPCRLVDTGCHPGIEKTLDNTIEPGCISVRSLIPSFFIMGVNPYTATTLTSCRFTFHMSCRVNCVDVQYFGACSSRRVWAKVCNTRYTFFWSCRGRHVSIEVYCGPVGRKQCFVSGEWWMVGWPFKGTVWQHLCPHLICYTHYDAAYLDWLRIQYFFERCLLRQLETPIVRLHCFD